MNLEQFKSFVQGIEETLELHNLEMDQDTWEKIKEALDTVTESQPPIMNGLVNGMLPIIGAHNTPIKNEVPEGYQGATPPREYEGADKKDPNETKC